MNRYNNIVAYDHSRVKVKASKGSGGTDYVNANYIDGYKHPNRYIAAQGPVPNSFGAHWQMVGENKIKVIVMVTNETEGGKLKCHKYWPEEGQSIVYGDVTVQNSGEQVFASHVERQFMIKYGNSTWPLTQFAYTSWPDHGVPDTTVEMLKFRSRVKSQSKGSDAPLLVHCSAGVGRTGTWIGLDRYLDSCADLNDSDSIRAIVEDMRMSRNYMVQAQAQYVYLYNACIDGVKEMLKAADNELATASMSEEEKAAEQARAVERDLLIEQQRFLSAAQGQSIIPDVRHSHTKENKVSELAIAKKVPPQARLQSLASSTAQWVNRQNVPMSPEEHGYRAETAPLELRLVALSEARLAWLTRYTDAEKTWQSAQDDEGVEYDVGSELTPLESRVASLAAAEEAWMLRGDAMRSAKEEAVRENLAALSARLESLQFTVTNSKARWQARGDGLRGKGAQPPDRGVDTVDRLGGLSERLSALQAEQSAWEKRDNMQPYEVDKFFQEVNTDFEKQAAIQAEQDAAAAEAAARASEIEAETKEAKKRAAAQEKAKRAEELRKGKVKKVAAEANAVKSTWDGSKIRAAKAAEASAQAAAEEAIKDAEEEAAARKEAALRKSTEDKAKAKAKAARFLAKQA